MFKILIIDDSSNIRKLLRKIITNAGFEVVGEAEDGKIGFEMYKELKPDLVFLDIMMPVCNGMKSLKLIREYDEKSKIIMLTANEKKDDVVNSINSGALDYILKPISIERVVKTINRILKD